jgi:para-aminobenzoate synthetase component 1
MLTLRTILEPLDLGAPGFYRAVDALHGERDFVLLDSRVADGRLGRYCFASYEPFVTLVSRDGLVTHQAPGRPPRTERSTTLAALARSLAGFRVRPGGRRPPFVGGAVGYLSYELAREIEALPRSTRDATGAPRAVFGLYAFALVLDRRSGRTWLAYLEPGAELGAPARDEVRGRILDAAGRRPARPRAASACGQPLTADFTEEEYQETIRRIQDYVRAGDVYQVNMTQRFHAPLAGRSAWELYRTLMCVNPAPYAAYLGFRDVQVASSSPERFLRVVGRRVETRPVKGTARRGATAEEDARLKARLLRSEKDLAELAMIVDVARNDLGRVCEVGSVCVERFPELESHASVHHLAATVRGTLRRDRGLCDLIAAAFPAASISGAPKIRAMEIIDELEPVERGVYTGAIGYLGFDGDADLNVAIRSLVVARGEAHLHAGGGVVAGSRPEGEYAESLLKARNLVRALTGAAPRGRRWRGEA